MAGNSTVARDHTTRAKANSYDQWAPIEIPRTRRMVKLDLIMVALGPAVAVVRRIPRCRLAHRAGERRLGRVGGPWSTPPEVAVIAASATTMSPANQALRAAVSTDV